MTELLYDVRLSHFDDSGVYFDMCDLVATDARDACVSAKEYAAEFCDVRHFKARVIRTHPVITI